MKTKKKTQLSSLMVFAEWLSKVPKGAKLEVYFDKNQIFFRKKP